MQSDDITRIDTSTLPTADDVARAKRDAIHELRTVVADLAADLGHQLGGWYESAPEEEVAYCRRCRRPVYIQLVRPPHFEGPALTQACRRPDAFLAHQSAADIAAAIEGAAGRFFPTLERGQ